LRSMVGGGRVFEDAAFTTTRTAKVEICKLCSDAGQTMVAAKKAKPA
jgi:hypothetical protein